MVNGAQLLMKRIRLIVQMAAILTSGCYNISDVQAAARCIQIPELAL